MLCKFVAPTQPISDSFADNSQNFQLGIRDACATPAACNAGASASGLGGGFVLEFWRVFSAANGQDVISK